MEIKNIENDGKDKGDSGGSIRLSTMLPFDVFSDFVKFCKENTKTGLNKWDYGSGIRILLMKAKEAENIEKINENLNKKGERIDILEDRIENVESIIKSLNSLIKLPKEVINE